MPAVAIRPCLSALAFGAESDVEVTKDFPLTIFPVYITQITQAEPVAHLEKEAVARDVIYPRPGHLGPAFVSIEVLPENRER